MSKEVDDFLRLVRAKVDYWAKLPDKMVPAGEDPVKWRVEGAAFSIMVLLDHGYHVVPIEGKRKNISGNLHDLLEEKKSA